MGLVKIAAANPFAFIPLAIGTTAAKSGNSFKYMMQKNNGPLSPRKHIQRVGLSTFSNSMKHIRDGKVPDVTRLPVAVLDTQLGHAMQAGLGIAESVYRNPKDPVPLKAFKKHILDNTITQDGYFNIGKIEKYLKTGKKIDRPLSKLDNAGGLSTYSAIGGVTGGAANAMSSYSKEKDPNLKRQAAMSGAIKGAIKGSAIATGAKLAITKARTVTSPLATAHDIYFSDPYWHSQLKAANSPIYHSIGRVGGKLFTSEPHKRAARIASSQAREELFNPRSEGFLKGFGKNFFSKDGRQENENNFQNYKSKFLQKFHNTDNQ